jgi:serine/threonine-protein kinase
MAADIERWMAAEPVTAWREPFSRRVRRWARRNRNVVATFAAAVMMALAGTAIVLTVQAQANRELRAANIQTLRERDLARQNFDLARRAVDDYLTRVGQNPLLKEGGLHDLRQELLEAALRYYRDFLDQRSDDPSLKVETAAAYERVGDILIELGRFGDALTAYDQAIALIEPLMGERPGDTRVAIARIRLLAGRLQALRDGGWYPEAMATFDWARTLGEGLLDTGGGTGDLPEILARIYLNAALVLQNIGSADDALRVAIRGHALAEQATRVHPGDLTVARTLLWISVQTGLLLRVKGRSDEARRLCEQGIGFGKERVRAHPRDVELRMNLAFLEGLLGEINQFEGRRLEALSLLRGTAESLGALARENPLLFRVRSRWADSLFSLSNLQADLGRYTEAEHSGRASIDLFEALARDVPSNSEFRIKAGWGYAVLGKVHLKRGSHGEALGMLRRATAILETCDDIQNLYNLACCCAMASTISDPSEGSAASHRQRLDLDRAISTIRRVIAMGFADANLLRTDPDLDPLRLQADFPALLMDVGFPADPFAGRRGGP